MHPFHLRKGNVIALPTLHYTMECAMHVKKAFDYFQPDCIAVELSEDLNDSFLHAASRLPDITLIKTSSLYYLAEPCDASFEALRLALESGLPSYCIDLHVDNYPLFNEALPDPYAISILGLEKYYTAYIQSQPVKHPLDRSRELHMARRLKELSCLYERVLFIAGFHHSEAVLAALDQNSFPLDEVNGQRPFTSQKIPRDASKLPEFEKEKPKTQVTIATLTEDSCRKVMAEYGWISQAYEEWRGSSDIELDRQQLILSLYKKSSDNYTKNTGNPFLGYHLRNTMKFARNYSLQQNRLLPGLFELLSCAKGCVDHNYAYEVWELATSYPFRKNIDNLQELDLSVEDIWGHSKPIYFHLKQRQTKGLHFQRRQKDRGGKKPFSPPSPFFLCSYPPEDLQVENFGDFLKKKGTRLLSEEQAHSIPFSTSLEEGLDVKETVRHWHEKKLYVRKREKPPQAASSVVIIFDEDSPEEKDLYNEKFPWKTSWQGEHSQESDMAFYATSLQQNIIGPGISRCEYGGFMLTSPPRRLQDVWTDPDYERCKNKGEVLLRAAIDYALKPLIILVAKKPPTSKIRGIAQRYGKKIVYLPLGSLSPIMLNKIRSFHALDGHDKREIAGDYIF